MRHGHGRLKLFDQALRNFGLHPSPARHDDGVGVFQQHLTWGRHDGDTASRGDRAIIDREGCELVPADPQFRSFEGKYLNRAAKFEGAQLVIDEGDDEMIFHGVMLPHIGISASSLARCYCVISAVETLTCKWSGKQTQEPIRATQYRYLRL